MNKRHYIYFFFASLLLLASCKAKNATTVSDDNTAVVEIQFDSDSAYAYCAQQCDFGPRTMNSSAHDLCGKWIADKFRSLGLTVIEQQATINGWDGTPLRSTNIIAQFKPERENRVLFCAHWDSRPWADNDPLEQNHRTPVMAANDGASGVAVMIELARQVCLNDSLGFGIDFVCFDAEDYGLPQWEEARDGSEDSWALGAQYWSTNLHAKGYTADFGILLDMVGGEGARFYQEGYSRDYAPAIVSRLWNAAQVAGYGSYFPNSNGVHVTDDHVPVNESARIPCIDVIPYYPDCSQSGFGPTWHTISDTMEHIDRNTLKAVGQTLIQLLYTE